LRLLRETSIAGSSSFPNPFPEVAEMTPFLRLPLRVCARRFLALGALSLALAVGITSCGGKGDKTAAKHAGLAGRWEQAGRQGGQGTTFIFGADKSFAFTMGIMLDAGYKAEGGKLTLLAPDSTGVEKPVQELTFSIARDTLTVEQSSQPPQKFARDGEGPGGAPIAGRWLAKNEGGPTAYLSCTPNGRFLFRVPLQTLEGTYVAAGDSLTVSVPNMPDFKVTFTVSGDTLTLRREGSPDGVFTLADEAISAGASRAAVPAGMPGGAPGSPHGGQPPAGATPPPVDHPAGGE
jgi:hypothetical protein